MNTNYGDYSSPRVNDTNQVPASDVNEVSSTEQQQADWDKRYEEYCKKFSSIVYDQTMDPMRKLQALKDAASSFAAEVNQSTDLTGTQKTKLLADIKTEEHTAHVAVWNQFIDLYRDKVTDLINDSNPEVIPHDKFDQLEKFASYFADQVNQDNDLTPAEKEKLFADIKTEQQSANFAVWNQLLAIYGDKMDGIVNSNYPEASVSWKFDQLEKIAQSLVTDIQGFAGLKEGDKTKLFAQVREMHDKAYLGVWNENFARMMQSLDNIVKDPELPSKQQKYDALQSAANHFATDITNSALTDADKTRLLSDLQTQLILRQREVRNNY